MVLSDEDILKFQALYKKEFGVEISKEDAYEEGIKILKLVSIVYKPIVAEDYKKLQKLTK
jgi:hypothetical protein